jgi:hypothetical protein
LFKAGQSFSLNGITSECCRSALDSTAAFFGVLMVALPLYGLLAAVGCGHRAVDERLTRGAQGDGRIDAQQGA